MVTEVAGRQLQEALDEAGRRGGGEVHLPRGVFTFSGTLRVPAHVTLSGEGRLDTTLQLVPDRTARFARLGGQGWDQAPGRIHSMGDRITYQIDVPRAGTWDVWVRYGTDMKPFDQPGVSGNHTLVVDDRRSGPASEFAEHRKLVADNMVEGSGTPAHARSGTP